jgi:hypothetical protein
MSTDTRLGSHRFRARVPQGGVAVTPRSPLEPKLPSRQRRILRRATAGPRVRPRRCGGHPDRQSRAAQVPTYQCARCSAERTSTSRPSEALDTPRLDRRGAHVAVDQRVLLWCSLGGWRDDGRGRPLRRRVVAGNDERRGRAATAMCSAPPCRRSDIARASLARFWRRATRRSCRATRHDRLRHRAPTCFARTGDARDHARRVVFGRRRSDPPSLRARVG